MTFSSALRYPFTNFAKVFSIVLAMTIAMAVFCMLLFNAFDFEGFFATLASWDGVNHPDLSPYQITGSAILAVFGILAVAIISGLWLSGYSVSVLRALLEGDQTLPPVQFGREVRDGVYLLLASLAYGLLFVALIMAVGIALGVTSGLGAINGLLGLGAFLAMICVAAVMGWAYFVGMARMAVDGHHRGAWQLRANMKIARDNWRWGAFLLLYMVLLTLLYGFVSSLADGIFGGIMGAAGMTLSLILYYFFNLMQHFSTQHLIAQYAVAVGIGGGGEKEKVGETLVV